MFAIVQNNEIVKTGSSLKQLFPKTSVPRVINQGVLDYLGAKEVVDGERKDERFYWVTPANPPIQLINGIPTRLYINTSKEINDREESDEEGNPLYVKVFDPLANDGEGAMVDSDERLVTKGLKSQWIEQTKDTANKLLQPTDWMVIRKVERDVAIPTTTATFRAAVITEASRLETAIAGAASVEALITVVNNQQWPSA